MQIKPKRGLSAARLRNVQTVIVESIAEKRQLLATLSGSDATATLASIANLERMLVGAIEMREAIAPDDNDEKSDFDAKSIAARHQATRYGHSTNSAENATREASAGLFEMPATTGSNDTTGNAGNLKSLAAKHQAARYDHAAGGSN